MPDPLPNERVWHARLGRTCKARLNIVIIKFYCVEYLRILPVLLQLKVSGPTCSIVTTPHSGLMNYLLFFNKNNKKKLQQQQQQHWLITSNTLFSHFLSGHTHNCRLITDDTLPTCPARELFMNTHYCRCHWTDSKHPATQW